MTKDLTTLLSQPLLETSPLNEEQQAMVDAHMERRRQVMESLRREADRDVYEALWQIIDDMGTDGLCCCPAAKAQGIAALARASALVTKEEDV